MMGAQHNISPANDLMQESAVFGTPAGTIRFPDCAAAEAIPPINRQPQGCRGSGIMRQHWQSEIR
jgi:hypothetical protein